MCLSLAHRSYAPFRLQKTPLPATFNLSFHEPTEEETTQDYVPDHFFPVNPGDLLHDRYEITAKLGWGRSSTVWLARDMLR